MLHHSSLVESKQFLKKEEISNNFSPLLGNFKKNLIISLSLIWILGLIGCTPWKTFIKKEKSIFPLQKKSNNSRIPSVKNEATKKFILQIRQLAEKMEKLPADYDNLAVNISPTMIFSQYGMPLYRIDSPCEVFFLGKIITHLQNGQEHLKIRLELSNQRAVEGYVTFQALSGKNQQDISTIKEVFSPQVLYEKMPETVF